MSGGSDGSDEGRPTGAETGSGYGPFHRLETLRAATNEAARTAGFGSLMFLLTCAYVLVAAYRVEDSDLLRERGYVDLPLIEGELSVDLFVVFAPVVVVAFHWFLLLQLSLLSERVNAYRESLARLGGEDRAQVEGLEAGLTLSTFSYVQWLTGRQRAYWRRLLLWLSCVLLFGIFPVFVLWTIYAEFRGTNRETLTAITAAVIVIEILLTAWMFFRPETTVAGDSTDAGSADGGQETKHWRSRFVFFRPRLGGPRRVENVLKFTVGGVLAVTGLVFTYAVLDRDFFVCRSLCPQIRLDVGTEEMRLLPEPSDEQTHKLAAQHVQQSKWDQLDQMNLPAFITTRRDLRYVIVRFRLMPGARFPERVDLRHADLSRAVLYRAALRGARLQHARLAQTNLRRARLLGANLRHAVLEGADLTGADLTGADLRSVRTDRDTRFCGADLAWAIIDDVAVTRVRGECDAEPSAVCSQNDIDPEWPWHGSTRVIGPDGTCLDVFNAVALFRANLNRPVSSDGGNGKLGAEPRQALNAICEDWSASIYQIVEAYQYGSGGPDTGRHLDLRDGSICPTSKSATNDG